MSKTDKSYQFTLSPTRVYDHSAQYFLAGLHRNLITSQTFEYALFPTRVYDLCVQYFLAGLDHNLVTSQTYITE